MNTDAFAQPPTPLKGGENISSEEYRTYRWADGDEITIAKPQLLYVTKNGHIISDEEGCGHYIPAGWRHLRWKAKSGVLVVATLGGGS